VVVSGLAIPIENERTTGVPGIEAAVGTLSGVGTEKSTGRGTRMEKTSTETATVSVGETETGIGTVVAIEQGPENVILTGTEAGEKGGTKGEAREAQTQLP